MGDSLKYKLGTITIVEGTIGALKAVAADSVQIKAPTGFLISKDSAVTITASTAGGLKLDNAGSPVNSISIKASSKDITGNYLSFIINTASAGTVDTLTISGLYVQSVDTVGVSYDSTTARDLHFTQQNVLTNSTPLSRLVALPGKAAVISFVAGTLPNASQSVINFISRTALGTPTTADTSKGIVLLFSDVKGNHTTFITSAPLISALITGQTAQKANGTLGVPVL